MCDAIRNDGSISGNPARIALIFVDGLGWGDDDPRINPCRDYGGRLFDFPRSPALCKPIDACLGVPGLPQSASGQTSLLTGINAQGRLGFHQTGFTTPELRKILLEHSIFRQLRDRDLDAVFINAFRPVFFELSLEQQLGLSATTVACLAADLPFFTLDDITTGRSIYQEFTNLELIARGFDLKALSPGEAGEILATNIQKRDFTLFEYFQTDRAGHSRDRERIIIELRKLEDFVLGVIKALDRVGTLDDTLVILTSDHGNLEDLTTGSHTRNPIPLMGWGRGAQAFLDRVDDLLGITPVILDLLDQGRRPSR